MTKKRFIWPVFTLLSLWGTYFVTLFARFIHVGTDGIVVGHENAWSDWALHIGLARIFATKSPTDWFAYHPVVSGGKLTYPFLTDLISGLLMRAGISLELSFIVPSILFAIGLLLGLYFLLHLITKSRWLPVLIISLFFLNSGFGWIHWVQDFITHPSWSFITYPPHDYSRFDIYQWYSGNAIVGMFVPQRAFLLGMAIATWVMSGVFLVIRRNTWAKKDRWILLAAGIAAGILPVTHMHTFMATFFVTAVACVVYAKQWRTWLWYVVPAGLMSGTLFYFFVAGGIANPHFFSWYPLWGSQNLVDWLVEWLWQWGLLLPILVVSWLFLWRKLDMVQRVWIGSFTILFLIAQFWLFQPVKWDNSKLFLWSSLGFCTLVVIGLKALWIKTGWHKFVVVLLAVSLTLTGVLELERLQRIDMHSYAIIGQEEVQLGDALQSLTGPRDVFLTATAHNHPVMVWGARSVVMGYTAWAWNFGFDYTTREQDIKTMYQADTDTTALLKRYKVDYIVFGPHEARIEGVNEDYYRARYPLLFQTSQYRVYSIK